MGLSWGSFTSANPQSFALMGFLFSGRDEASFHSQKQKAQYLAVLGLRL